MLHIKRPRGPAINKTLATCQSSCSIAVGKVKFHAKQCIAPKVMPPSAAGPMLSNAFIAKTCLVFEKLK
jgi:hypothetical protein